ncbi:hypothetical protein [uncultured Abiotrophia sp.]|uniref:hypothetical protein n=1 Tax=uncultured Abiotrophia sp. TaxID=316094 RepID=UPI00260CC1B7|nr:hypothetical protein [uncultured Abiotrophia sp.]
MFIGKLHRFNVVLLAGLFFAATGIGFAFHRELQYALVSLIIASIIDLFVGGFMNQFQSSVAEAAFAKELKTLSSFLIYGVLPGVYLMAVTNAGAFSLIVFALYILAVGIRLAYFNQAAEFQDPVDKRHSVGLPLELGVFAIQVVSLVGFLLPLTVFQIFLMLVYALLAVAFVYKLKIPRLPSQWLFYMVGVQVVLCILWVFLGNFITG